MANKNRRLIQQPAQKTNTLKTAKTYIKSNLRQIISLTIFVLICIGTILSSRILDTSQKAQLVYGMCFQGLLAVGIFKNKTRYTYIKLILWIITIIIIKFIL